MPVIYGLFRPSLTLELTIEVLKERGFPAEGISLAAVSYCKPEKPKILDSMYSNDGKSLIDGMAFGGTVGMVLGVIYGSIVSMGPVALGLIGLLAGAAIGYLVDREINKKNVRGTDPQEDYIMIAVTCRSEDEAVLAGKIMTENNSSWLGKSLTAS